MKHFAAIVLAFAAILPVAWLRGFVICKLWGWFIVPQFHAAPLALVSAVGVSLIVAILTFQANGYKYSEDPLVNAISLISTNVLMSLLGWLGGWVYLAVFT